MRKTVNIILLAVLIIMITGLLFVINADIDDKPKVVAPNNDVDIQLSKEDIPKLVEIIKIWKLVDELEIDNLGEEKLGIFLAKYKQLDRIRSQYWKDRNESIGKIRKLNESKATDEQVRQALDEFRRIELSYSEKEKQLKDTLNSGLTSRQQAKLLVFHDNHWRDMRRLVRNLEKMSQLRERSLKLQPEPLSKN